MASRLILKDVRAPIRFLLRNPASSAPSKASAPLAQTIQNLLIPRHNPQSDGEFIGGGYRFGIGELGFSDRPVVSMDLKPNFDGGFRIEVGGKRQPLDDDDYQSESDSDEFHGGSDVDSDGDAYDFDDADVDDGDEE